MGEQKMYGELIILCYFIVLCFQDVFRFHFKSAEHLVNIKHNSFDISTRSNLVNKDLF
jgi:hypothetical protein